MMSTISDTLFVTQLLCLNHKNNIETHQENKAIVNLKSFSVVVQMFVVLH
jgi:hypothetical protein